jgi:DNA-directed RNA polymerase specialized sigma24 family protein
MVMAPATAVAMAQVKPPKLNKRQKKNLRTGPIRDIENYIRTFTTKFCNQYGIPHWQEDVASECLYKWWKATESHPEKMTIPAYAKRCIYNAAIQWEKRYRKENHMDELDNLETYSTTLPDPAFDLDLTGLNDVECLIVEFHYGFGRGAESEMSLSQIAHKLKRSETWVRSRHASALNILKGNISPVTFVPAYPQNVPL